MKQPPIKRYMPDCSIHAVAEIAFMRETPDGNYVSFDDYWELLREVARLRRRTKRLERKNFRLALKLFKERHPFLSAANWIRSKLKRGKS